MHSQIGIGSHRDRRSKTVFSSVGLSDSIHGDLGDPRLRGAFRTGMNLTILVGEDTGELSGHVRAAGDTLGHYLILQPLTDPYTVTTVFLTALGEASVNAILIVRHDLPTVLFD